jgi:hypothetical protein
MSIEPMRKINHLDFNCIPKVIQKQIATFLSPQDLIVTHKFLESDSLIRVSFSFNLRENNEQQRMGSKAMAGGGVRG